VKEPVQFHVRKSSSQVTGCTLFLKKVGDFLLLAIKTQVANAADSFTVKIKQIKQSNSQGGARAVDLSARSFDLARPDSAPPLAVRHKPSQDFVWGALFPQKS